MSSRRLAALPVVPRPVQERRPSLLRRGLVGLLVLAPLALLGWLLLSSPLLALERVEVVGTSRLSVQQVVAAVDAETGTPLARLDTSAARDRVAGLPAVADAEVSRAWPGTLRVTVTERVPVAARRAAGQGWELVDGQGTGFATEGEAPAGLPRLDTPAASSDPATRAAVAVLRDLAADLLRRVESVRAQTSATVTLALRGDRTVVWGTPGETALKVAVIEALGPRKGQTLDVTSPAVAVVRR